VQPGYEKFSDSISKYYGFKVFALVTLFFQCLKMVWKFCLIKIGGAKDKEETARATAVKSCMTCRCQALFFKITSISVQINFTERLKQKYWWKLVFARKTNKALLFPLTKTTYTNLIWIFTITVFKGLKRNHPCFPAVAAQFLWLDFCLNLIRKYMQHSI